MPELICKSLFYKMAYYFIKIILCKTISNDCCSRKYTVMVYRAYILKVVHSQSLTHWHFFQCHSRYSRYSSQNMIKLYFMQHFFADFIYSFWLVWVFFENTSPLNMGWYTQ